MPSPGVLLILKKGVLQGWAVASQSHNLSLQDLWVKNKEWMFYLKFWFFKLVDILLNIKNKF